MLGVCLTPKTTYLFLLQSHFRLFDKLFDFSRTRTNSFFTGLFHSSSPIIVLTIIRCRICRGCQSHAQYEFNLQMRTLYMLSHPSVSLSRFISANICGLIFYTFTYLDHYFDHFSLKFSVLTPSCFVNDNLSYNLHGYPMLVILTVLICFSTHEYFWMVLLYVNVNILAIVYVRPLLSFIFPWRSK